MRYKTVVVDPPWKVKAGTLKGREGWLDAQGSPRDLPYDVMTVEEIAAQPIGEIAEPDSHLYLWTINKYLPVAFGVAKAWGFTYSTILTWSKTPMGGGLGGCYGISAEYILFCRRGTLPAKTRVRGTVFHWKRPYDERGKPRSSAKPPEAREMFERVSPGPYVELFSRERVARPGWHYHGNESPIATVRLT